MTERHYSGSELDLFAKAFNWKRYWSSIVVPYLHGDVLDVGAGLGATIATLAPRQPEARWTALEPDPSLVARLTSEVGSGTLPSSTRVVQGITADLVGGAQFDTVLYIDVLEHIDDDSMEVTNAERLLRSGGHLVIVAPAHNWLFTPFDRAIGHYRRYSSRVLRGLLSPRLEICELRYLDSVGLLASLANRLLLNTADPKPSQIAVWDKAMVPFSRILDPLLRGSLGKSVVAVARKR